MERKLNEQWVEVIDGKKHMLKAVEGENCTGCAFGKMCQGSRLNNIHVCDREDDCPLEYSNTVVKDLGVLNDDGLLPCPFCGEYPKIIHPTENMPVVSIVHTGEGHRILLEFFRSKQQAIDAWNRRT